MNLRNLEEANSVETNEGENYVPIPVHLIYFPAIASISRPFEDAESQEEINPGYWTKWNENLLFISQEDHYELEDTLATDESENVTFSLGRKACEILYGLQWLAYREGLLAYYGKMEEPVECRLADLLSLYDYPSSKDKGFSTELYRSYERAIKLLSSINVYFEFPSLRKDFKFERPFLEQEEPWEPGQKLRAIIPSPSTVNGKNTHPGYIRIAESFFPLVREMRPRELGLALLLLNNLNLTPSRERFVMGRRELAKRLLIPDSNITRAESDIKTLYEKMLQFGIICDYQLEIERKRKPGISDLLIIDKRWKAPWGNGHSSRR